MELEVRDSGTNAPVVAARGEVDVEAAPSLREALSELLQSGRPVVVDLTDVSFLDSTGLGALVAARTAATERGVSLPLVCSQPRILKLFTITGLDDLFPMHESVDAALASLA